MRGPAGTKAFLLSEVQLLSAQMLTMTAMTLVKIMTVEKRWKVQSL